MDKELNFNILKQILEYKLFLFNTHHKLDIKLKLNRNEILNSFNNNISVNNPILNRFIQDRKNNIYYIINEPPYCLNKEYAAIKIDYKNI